MSLRNLFLHDNSLLSLACWCLIIKPTIICTHIFTWFYSVFRDGNLCPCGHINWNVISRESTTYLHIYTCFVNRVFPEGNWCPNLDIPLECVQMYNLWHVCQCSLLFRERATFTFFNSQNNCPPRKMLNTRTAVIFSKKHNLLSTVARMILH